MRRWRSVSLLIVTVSVCLFAWGCQHAVSDGDDGASNGETVVRAMHTLVRVPTDNGRSFVHFGFHRHRGWGLETRPAPLDTSVLDPAFEPQESPHGSVDSAGEIRTAVQGQQSGPFGGIFGDDEGARFDASVVAGIRFSAATPRARGFSATAPGAGDDLPPVSVSDSGPEFSASAAGVGGAACSLRPLCEFVEAACNYRPRSVGGESVITSCDAVDQCYATIDEAAAQLQSQLSKKTFCRAADILTCAVGYMRSNRTEPAEGVAPFTYLVTGGFEHCFERYGVDLDEQLGR